MDALAWFSGKCLLYGSGNGDGGGGNSGGRSDFAMFAIRTLILNTIFEIFVSYFYAVQIQIE